MEVLQIDHTPVDVIVVDQEQRLPIGRPWLTLAIDVASRSIAGFSVSLESPSSLSVSLALSHAVLPKIGWLADRELHTLDWPMGGLPASIHVDNAKEFHSERWRVVVRNMALRLNIAYRVCLTMGAHRAHDRNHDGSSPFASRYYFLKRCGERNLRLRRTCGPDPVGVGALAGAADCRSLPSDRPLGFGQDAFGGMA